MRISEVLGAEVRDGNGRRLGKVRDVRLVQDGPAVAGQDLAFRVDAVLVGPTGSATRLGYTRNQVQGPWLIRVIATWRERATQEIPWHELTHVEGRLVHDQKEKT
jgi:sporulation protein YlmC with PRC-barrel domain